MKGDIFPPEAHSFKDRETGVTVRQLTSYKGHSHHFYFTNAGWWDGGKHLLFGSDRNNCTDLYSLEIATGEIRQLTEHSPETEIDLLFSCVNPVIAEVYLVREHRIWALDLNTLEERVIYELTPGYKLNILNCTADGRSLCTGIFEDLSSKFEVDLLHGYVGFADYCAAKPTSRIVRIPVDGSALAGEVVFEEQSWIGHVNTSPRHPNLVTYCHEGPWDVVDHRIWALDMNTGRNWRVRPSGPKDMVGHEYWLTDGETIGYHGKVRGKPVFGFVRYDNSDVRESAMPVHSQHFHSNTTQMIVGDGNGTQVPYVLLWTYDGKRISAPRILCAHHGSRHIQQNHIHPRFTPDGRFVLFTSDRSGYGQLYLAEVPPLETLPILDAKRFA